MAPYASSSASPALGSAKTLSTRKLHFNVDAAAIGIALALAALVRLNVLPRIGW